MAVFNTFGVVRGVGNLGNDLDVHFGTLDLATVQSQSTLLVASSGSLTVNAGSLATDSAAYTALAGSIVSAITLGHTVSAGDVTLVGSLTTSSGSIAVDSTAITARATAIAAESAAIIAAAGTVADDIFLAVNTGTGSNLMDVRLAVDTIEMYLLSGKPVNAINFPTD